MRLPSLLLAAALLPGLCAAQESSDNAVHAVTVLHQDGSKTVTITDPEKHTSEASTYDGRYKLTERIVYALDENDRPATGVVYTPESRPLYKSVYKRDALNRISEEDDFKMDDQPIGRFVYEYGADGKLHRIRAYDSQGNEVHASAGHRDVQQMPPRVH